MSHVWSVFVRVGVNGGSAPVTDDGEVVLDALVVDVGIRLEQGHGDLCRANVGSIGDGGHSLGQPPNRPPCSSSSLGEVEHRHRRWGRVDPDVE